MPRTVSIRTPAPASLARSRARCTSMVLEPNASASLSHTCWAIERRSATPGERRSRISRRPNSMAGSAHLAEPQPGRLADRGPALQGPQPGQQLTEVERLDQVVIGARVQAGDP